MTDALRVIREAEACGFRSRAAADGLLAACPPALPESLGQDLAVVRREVVERLLLGQGSGPGALDGIERLRDLALALCRAAALLR